jgi:uncharacterized coiled-coil DUF342 family protein
MSDELNKRNTETVKAALKEMDKKILDQQIRIDGLHATLSTVNNQIAQLQQTVGMLRAMLAGSGPTSR